MLIDGSGLLLAPLVRRSPTPAGLTPLLRQKASHRDKVSLIAALCVSPWKRYLSLWFRIYPREYVNNERSADVRSLDQTARRRLRYVNRVTS